MRKNQKCRMCGEDTDSPYAYLCPDCRKEQKQSNVIGSRTCATCGTVFEGGPRAKYCPNCRKERQKKADAEAYRRKVAGKTRRIGSEDVCERCGKTYTVNSGRQRYCPECAPLAVAEIDRRQGIEWYNKNGGALLHAKYNEAKKGSAKTCIICGKEFESSTTAATCCKECQTEYRKIKKAEWEKSHREERNEYHRNKRREKEEKR